MKRSERAREDVLDMMMLGTFSSAICGAIRYGFSQFLIHENSLKWNRSKFATTETRYIALESHAKTTTCSPMSHCPFFFSSSTHTQYQSIAQRCWFNLIYMENIYHFAIALLWFISNAQSKQQLAHDVSVCPHCVAHWSNTKAHIHSTLCSSSPFPISRVERSSYLISYQHLHLHSPIIVAFAVLIQLCFHFYYAHTHTQTATASASFINQINYIHKDKETIISG